MSMEAVNKWAEDEKRQCAAIQQLHQIAIEFPELTRRFATVMLQESDGSHAKVESTRPGVEVETVGPKAKVQRRTRTRPADNLPLIHRALINEPNGLSLLDIAGRTGLTRSAVRHVVETVYSEEFERQPDSNDARTNLVLLSDDARARIQSEKEVAMAHE